MDPSHLELISGRIKFQELLKLVDLAIKKNEPIQITKSLLNQKNNNILFLKWLQKNKIINLLITEKPQTKRHSLNSRQRKIEISLQLKALGIKIASIAKHFKVKNQTVQGYFRALRDYDKKYLNALNLILSLKKITENTQLSEFPIFPVRMSMEEIKKNVSAPDIKVLEEIMKESKWIKIVTGKNIGTSDISILFPRKK